MPFIPKTNWKLDDTVTPADMNRIEAGINSAFEEKTTKVTGVSDEVAAFTSTGDLKSTGKTISSLTEATAHPAKAVTAEEGIHGLRYYDDTLSRKVGSNWVEIETGGGGVDTGSTAPTNTSTLWIDPNDGYIAKYFSAVSSSWVPLSAVVVWG